MFDWLMPQTTDTLVSPGTLALRLSVALALGACVALVYRISHGREHERSEALSTTLVLLAVLIAMVSIVIGNSVARAFSLVGALSIVRFRTVVDDTRDTAFVIFSVIVGMAAGDGQFLVALIGIPVVGAAAVALSAWKPRRNGRGDSRECELSLRLALGRDPDALVGRVLHQHLESVTIVSTSTAKQGAALDFTYRGRISPQSSMTALITELNQLEGVMNVEIRWA
ncbi:MAG TPA: DUF4956 domain-containing protein [Planctomycetaceae bacterium]|nr:DUF4956 domain-containing protein [Planctomycetaceae bacterium]